MDHEWAKALTADFDSVPQITVPRIAAALGKSESHVYQALRGERPFTLAQVGAWYDLTGARHLAQWFGHVTNHHVAPIPLGRVDDVQYADLLREFSEAVSAYTMATADGEVTVAEAEAVGAQLDDVIVAAQRLKLATERRARVVSIRPATMAEAERRNGGAA